MESNKRWIVETINDGKAEYISFIDIVEGKLKVELTDDISKAIKYRTEFRAKDDSQYVNSAIRNKKSDSLQQQIGEKHFSFRLFSDSEVSI